VTLVTTAHASGLHAVERSLDALHREVLRSAADQAGEVRLSVLNLVAACIDDRDADLAARTLTAIGARHPARVIVVRADPDATDAAIEADVGLQRTPVGESEVYTELMRLIVRGHPAFHLSSVVSPLLIPDIPTDLWVVGAPRLVQAFSDEVVALCHRIIVDSDAYPRPAEPLHQISAEIARHGDGRLIADIAWERTRQWRELVAQAFDSAPAVEWLRHVSAVRLACTGTRVPAHGWLLAGWLASRLGWRHGVEPVELGLAERAGGPDGVCTLRIEMERDGDRRCVVVEAHDGVLQVESDAAGGSVSRTVPQHRPQMTALMSMLLDESRLDLVYPQAVTRAAALIR
jgi:glucose-6-phosphate dehydrogenase assembly protein OpcA